MPASGVRGREHPTSAFYQGRAAGTTVVLGGKRAAKIDFVRDLVGLGATGEGGKG